MSRTHKLGFNSLQILGRSEFVFIVGLLLKPVWTTTSGQIVLYGEAIRRREAMCYTGARKA